MDTPALRELILSELCRIAPEITPDEVPNDEDLRDAVDLDSMDFLHLVAAVSKKSGVMIPEADYPKIMTLQRMLDYLQHQTE